MSIATGFVDFSTGRESIVTAPGAGSPTEVKVFAFPLLKPIGKAGQRHASGENRPAREHRLVHSVRQGLSGWRFTRDGLARRLARRRQAHCRQPARGQRFGKDLLERLRTGRRARRSICRAPCTTATAPNSARSPTSSHSMDLPARGSPRPARRRAPTCWSAVLRPGARTQASSNTSSSGRRLSQRHCKPCVSDRSGPEKHRSLPSSAAIRQICLGSRHPRIAGRSDCESPVSVRGLIRRGLTKPNRALRRVLISVAELSFHGARAALNNNCESDSFHDVAHCPKNVSRSFRERHQFT